MNPDAASLAIEQAAVGIYRRLLNGQ